MMRKEKATLIERESDWFWVEMNLPYPSASNALAAVQYADAEATKRGVSTIRTIDWEATTLAGKYILLAVTGRK